MVLRLFEKNDSLIISNWIKDEKSLFQWAADRFGTFPLEPEKISSSYLEQMKSKKFFSLTAIDDKNNILGNLIIRYPNPEDETTVRFGFVIVNPEIRGQGNGKKLISLALEFAKNQLNAKKVTLGAFENNPSAVYCYKSSGFRTTGNDNYVLNGENWNCIEMEYNF